MNSRKMILSGAILAAILVLTVAVQPAFAGSTDVSGGPTPDHPEVFLLKKTFSICDQGTGEFSGNAPLPGGSVPPSGQQSGCVDLFNDRFNEYLFTGEQVGVLVAVRHLNGAEEIVKASLALDGDVKSICNDITADEPGLASGNLWYGHDVSADLAQQPPAKSGGTTTGFDSNFDKLYQCQYTATEGDSGEKTLTVIATDQEDNTGESVPDQIYFNPEILIDVFTSDGGPVQFADGTSGMTVYSTNTLKIKNEAEGGVDLVVWLAGTDLVSSTGPAKCPDSNVLNVDQQMEYRCKLGTIFNNPWSWVPNPNDKEDCTTESCQGATPLLPDHIDENILGNGHTAECWFRLTYPTPCSGTFDQGQILIYARAI